MARETEANVRPSLTPAPVPTDSGTAVSGQHLTEVQIGSMVQNLLRQNVPGPVIGTFVENMLRGEGSSAVETNADHDAPPGYE